MADKAVEVTEKFAGDIFALDEDALYAGRSIACGFIEKRGLLDEFAEFAITEATLYHENEDMASQAGPCEPSEEFLRERVAKLEQWLANAKKDLAGHQAFRKDEVA